MYNRQGAIWPVEACVSLWIGRPQTEVPDVEMGVNYFFHLWNLGQSLKFASIFRIHALFYSTKSRKFGLAYDRPQSLFYFIPQGNLTASLAKAGLASLRCLNQKSGCNFSFHWFYLTHVLFFG